MLFRYKFVFVIIIYKYYAIEIIINNMTYTSLVILVKVSNKSVSDNHVCQP